MKKSNILNKMSLFLVLMLVAAMTLGCGKETETEVATEAIEASTDATEETTDTSVDTKDDDTEEIDTEAASESDDAEAPEYEKIGEGSTVFYFVMTDGTGASTGYEVSTDEKTVGAALLALDLINGDESEYGLFVTKVLGNDPISEADGTPYWAFYIDGEYAMTGVDSTDITEGSTYSFTVETY